MPIKDNLQIQPWLLTLSQRWKFALAYIIVAVALIHGFAALFLPQKYKVTTVIHIANHYFQQPVVEDLVPSSLDPSESRALREGLIHEAWSRSFLEELRARWNLFPPLRPELASADLEYERKMQDFDKKVEVFSISATSFQLSYWDTTAERAWRVGQALQVKLQEYLQQQRRHKLEVLRESLQARLENLKLQMKVRVENSDAVQKLDQERFADFLRRLDRLNLMMDYETQTENIGLSVIQAMHPPMSPISPNWWLLLAWGLLLGGFLAASDLAWHSSKVVTVEDFEILVNTNSTTESKSSGHSASVSSTLSH